MTFVSVLAQRSLTPPPARARLARIDVIQAIRRIALDLDADGTARTRFLAVLGQRRGEESFRALCGLVMALCCQGRRPFVVGHPRSPMPSATERHVLALLAAAQAACGDEVDVRLTTLLPAPWREAAREDLVLVAAGLAVAGLPLATHRRAAPPRCPGWSDKARSAAGKS